MSIVRVTDDRKRDLTFGAAPRRVVSLVPSDTYNVAALGCAGALVGRTDYCELPADVTAKLPSVGGTKDPDVERIAELAPDLVIANQEENSRRDLEALAQRGLKVYVAFPRRAADGVAHLARLARIFRVDGDPAVRAMLKQGYEVLRDAEDARAADEREGAAPLSTFCPIWMDPLMTINGDTFISDVLELAGARNVFADRERRYPLAADLGAAEPLPPELVLLPDEPHPFSEADAAVLGALAIPAASRGAIVRTSGKDLCWYGARTIEGLPRVRALVGEHRARRLAGSPSAGR